MRKTFYNSSLFSFFRAAALIMAFLFTAAGSNAQITIFSENIGTPGGTTTIAAYAAGTAPATFQNKGTLTYSDGGQANPADVRVTSTSSGYTGASGNGNVFFTGTSGAYGFSIESINASGYTSLTLQYGYRKEAAGLHATFSVDYWDGAAWNTLANTSANLFNEAAGAATGWYLSKTLSLPAAAQINGLKIRFVKTGTNSIRLDDIILKGTYVNPLLAITGTPTDHGSVCPNTSASAVTYTITNSGATAASGVTVTSSDPQFVVSNLSSTSIAGSNGTATYKVTFTPTSAGAQTATITVASTTGGSNSPTSSLTGTGTASVAQTVTSSAATSITTSTATLNGNLTQLGVCPATSEKGFVWSLTSTNASPAVGGSGVTKTSVAGLSTGAYTLGVSSLTAGANYSFASYVYDGTSYVYGSVLNFTTLKVPPTLTAAAGATVDNPFDVTFTDDAAWRAAVTGITISSTGLTAGSSVLSGKITFTPSASNPTTLLQTAGTKTIAVQATGYADASVSQAIGVGAANKLFIQTQPTAPTNNGGTLAQQPVILVQDQYGNTVTSSSAIVTATATSGLWTIGGTTGPAASSGVATFTNLTAYKAGGLSGATITFSSPGLTGIPSNGFNIPTSASTDYFQSTAGGGDWGTVGTWLSSPDNGATVPFAAASMVPTSSATAITVVTGATVTITSSQSSNKLTVQTGATINYSSGTFTINDGSGDDVILSGSGSNFIVSGSVNPTFSGSALFRIGTGAVLTLSGSNGISNYHNSNYIYADGAVFEYSYTTAPSIQFTFFPTQDANAIPIFRYNSSYTGNMGGAGATTINGKVEVSSGRTMNISGVTGTLTVRNGIIGAGAYKNTTSTVTNITGSTAEIGGTGNLDAYVTIASGSVTTLTSNKSFLTSKVMIVNGTFDLGTFQMSAPSGSSTVTVGTTGTLRTAHTSGLTGSGSIGTNLSLSALPNGSTVEYYSTSAQVITALPYQNLTINGNSVKTTSGAMSIGASGQGPNFYINAGTVMLGGNLTFTTGTTAAATIAVGATLNTGSATYQVTGSSSANIYVNGTFVSQHTGGLYGGSTAIPGIKITFNSGSTAEYGGASQSFEPFSINSQLLGIPTNITFSGTGTKTGGSAATLNPGLITIKASVIVDATGGASFGGTNTALTMETNSKLSVSGSSTQPNMTGAYSLATGSTIEFAGSSATDVRVSPSYYNIIISGTNVSTGTNTASIGLQSGGSFTVNAGAKFKTRNANGFSGGASTSVSSTNNPTVVLAATSTIDYSEPIAQAITNQVAYGNLEISASSGTKTASAGTTSVKGNITKSGTASFAANKGTITLDGTSATTQAFTAVDSLDFYRLINNNSNGGFTVNGHFGIDSLLNLTSGSKLFFGTGDISIRSRSALTGAIGNTTGALIDYSGAGRFIIEKYIKTARRWQLLSPDATVPTSGSTSFYSSWAESQSSVSNGYGMWVTGATGTPNFDATTTLPTIKYWNGTLDGSGYAGITALTDDIHAHSAYMTFVRGDRASTGSNTAVLVPTTLRTRGQIHTGNYPAGTGSTTVPAVDGLVAIGNPYASPIDLRYIRTDGTGTLTFYTWDPKLTTGYGVGAFQTISGTQAGNFTITPGNGSYSVGNGGIMNTIESGQAFFVAASASGNLQIQFYESAKGSFANTVSFTGGQEERLGGELYLKDNVQDVLMDGFLIKYDNHYNDAADNSDAKKLANTNENISIKSGNKLLAVELKKPVNANDTIFINMANMRVKDYSWTFSMDNMDKPGRHAFLIDRFTGTQKTLDLTSDNTYDFSVSSAVGSNAADRFIIVFKPGNVVPVHFTAIAATRNTDKTVTVKWNTENEINMQNYAVEYSADGTAFNTISTALPTANNGGSAAYSYIDGHATADMNYYRIRGNSINGQAQYSAIAKVGPLNETAGISIYPNPVEDQTLNLRFAEQPPGKYTLQVTDESGRIVLTRVLVINSSNTIQMISLPANTAAGSYRAAISNASGKISTISFVVK